MFLEQVFSSLVICLQHLAPLFLCACYNQGIALDLPVMAERNRSNNLGSNIATTHSYIRGCPGGNGDTDLLQGHAVYPIYTKYSLYSRRSQWGPIPVGAGL